jgi:hypothetical protein
LPDVQIVNLQAEVWRRKSAAGSVGASPTPLRRKRAQGWCNQQHTGVFHS